MTQIPQPLDEVPCWHWKALAFWHAVAAVLLGSWFLPLTRVWWDRIDEAAFYLLNGSLALGHWWQINWAIANARQYDVFAAIIMIGVLLHYTLTRRKPQIERRLAVGLYTGLYLLLVLTITREFLFANLERHSPSLVLEPFIDLREQVPWAKPKTQSQASFPGDHATTTIIYVCMLWCLAGRKYGIIGALLGILFVMPRMVGGAHWLTDTIMGGGIIAMLTTSWALCTPLRAWSLNILTRLIAAIGRHLPHQFRPFLTRWERG